MKNKQLYLHYDDLTELNTVLDSSAILFLEKIIHSSHSRKDF